MALRRCAEGLRQKVIADRRRRWREQDFPPLARALGNRRAVVLLSAMRARSPVAVADCGVLEHVADIDQAVAVSGMRSPSAADAVLLSPVCSNLDMFRNLRASKFS